MKRCAAILVDIPITVAGVAATKREWKIINDPTIGDIRSLRQKGALIMRQVIERYGKEVHKYWVTDCGYIVVHRTDYL